jgi:glutamate:GABA antiporter
MEMSAVHAEDVKNPQRDYPRALLYSGAIILTTLMFASLAIAIVIPQPQISLVTGLIDAFQIFFTRFHMTWMIPIIAVLIILGGLSGVSAWIIGPTKGLLAAAEDGCLPQVFRYTTDKGAPIALLMMQGIIFSVLCSVFLLMPSINSAYWILSALTAQLAMLVYLFMFGAGIKLRYKHPEIRRAYRVPGGKLGMWIVGITGSSTCLFAIGVGFFPPPDLGVGLMFNYEAILLGGIIIFCAMPLLLYRVEKGDANGKIV